MLALTGVVLGVIGAFGAVRLIAHHLYGVRATDARAFIVVASMLLFVAMIASFLPARRAAGVDPLIALRQE